LENEAVMTPKKPVEVDYVTTTYAERIPRTAFELDVAGEKGRGTDPVGRGTQDQGVVHTRRERKGAQGGNGGRESTHSCSAYLTA